MKLKQLFLCCTACVVLTGVAMGQTTRVAYVDIDRVTEKSEKINQEMGNVKNKVEEIQKDIETKRKRALDLETEIKKGDGVLADSELKKKREEASKLKTELDDLQMQGRREMQKLDTTLFEPMVKTIVLAIQDVAKEQNIDLVVRGEAVIYGADSADITDAVIKKLNGPDYNRSGGSRPKASDDESSKSGNTAKTPAAKEPVTKAAETPESESKTTEASASETPAPTAERSIFPSVPLVKRPVDRQSE